MANTLRFKRGLATGIPTALAGEPLFTTDTFDLYIGNGTTNTRFQKYIASGTTSQLLRGDGSLLTMPIVLTSPANGEVLKYNGTNWVNSSDAGITGSGSAGQVAYFTGATTQAGNNNLFWDATNFRLGIGTNTPTAILDATISANAKLIFQNSSQNNLVVSGTNASLILNTTSGSFPVVRLQIAGSNVGGIEANGTSSIDLVSLVSNIPITFRQVGTERARIHASTGNFGIGTGATDSGRKLQVIGTGYFSDSVGIGNSGSVASSLRISKALATGNTIGIYMDSQIQSTLSNVAYFQSEASTSASAITVTNLRHFFATQPSVGAGSTITNQYGFFVQGTMTGATNDYAFFSDLAAATNVWNLYMNGTANNYMAGALGIGQTTLNGVTLRASKSITGLYISSGGSFGAGIVVDGTIQSDEVGGAAYFRTAVTTQAASFTAGTVFHYEANQGGLGAGSAIGSQAGFFVNSNLTGATNNFGFYGNIASGTGRWNLYMAGTALNYLNGNTLIGSTTDSGEKLQVTGTMKVTGATSIDGTTFNVDATNDRVGILTSTPQAPLQIGNGYTFGGYTGFRTTNSPAFLIALDSTDVFHRILGGTYNTASTINIDLALPLSKNLDVAGSGFRITSGVGSGVATVNGYLAFSSLTGNTGGTFTATERMRLDASGNLGLGVTPSAWGSTSRAMQLGTTSGLENWTGSTVLENNGFRNSAGDYKYLTSSFAASYALASNGQHEWYTAPSGTATNTITFTQIMTLFNDGNLALNTVTNSGFKFDVNGTARITSKLSMGAGTTSNAQINLASSTAPSSPNNGDIWFDGTDLKMRIGGVTKTFTLV
jgi:hypothetical protein